MLEQLTSSPWNNFLFMSYYGLVVEGTVTIQSLFVFLFIVGVKSLQCFLTGRPWKLVKHKVGKDFSTIQFTAWKVKENIVTFIFQLQNLKTYTLMLHFDIAVQFGSSDFFKTFCM